MNKFNDEELERIWQDTLKWLFNTKLGHFLFIVIIAAIISGIVGVFTKISFAPMMLGVAFTATIFAIIDKNDKWI
jgi:hypothetical protein